MFNIERFIAGRLSRSRSGGNSSVMVRVATISIAVSVAVMVIAVAVVLGFKREITSKVVGFGSDFQIVNFDSNTSYETTPISDNQPFIDSLSTLEGVTSINRYAVKAGVMRLGDAIQGVVLKGVDSLYNLSFFETNLIDGRLPNVSGERKKEILVSKMMASSMSLKVGDKLEMMFVGDPVRRDLFTISGIYDTALSEFDKVMSIVDIRNVQRLNGWQQNQITGFEVRIADFSLIDTTLPIVEDIVYEAETPEEPVMVVSAKEKYISIFDWLALQDINIVVVMIIMLTVTSFSMIAMMLILLLERTQMIGILKALGMSDSALQRMFLYRSIPIILRGVIYGNIVALVLCYIQKYFGILTLNETGYFLTVVPIYINWLYISLISMGSALVILIIQIIPTFVISKISSAEVIKYE